MAPGTPAGGEAMMRAMLFALVFLAACSSQTVAEGQGKTVTEEPWVVSLQSSGGFTGRGAGSVTVGSNGSATAGHLRGRDAVGQLSEEEMKRWRGAVANASKAEWIAPQNDGRGADMIEYRLELRTDAGSRSVQWREDVTEKLSPELRALYELAVQTRDRLLTPQ